MNRKIFLSASLIATLLLIVLVSGFSRKPQTDDRPNILLIVSEDHSPHLSCYGDKVIKTPNLDRIAASGCRFNNAYVSESVCSPSRSTILSGLYPHQTGHFGLTTYNFGYAVPVNTIYERLNAAGYRTGMIGKLHVFPESNFPIQYHPLTSANYERKDMSRYADFADKFINADKAPFFLMVNYPDAHWPFIDQINGSPKHPITPDQVKPFDYLPFDNATIRNYTTSIYNCLLRLDECVGDLMAKLKNAGKERNTLVFFLSDHGDEMARGKFDIYEAGTKVPFMMSWPGKINNAMVSNQLISTIDIVPTILDVAKLPADMQLPGKSLMQVFKNPKSNFRQYLYTEKNIDQPDLYYPRRAVRDGKYKLIYSLLDKPDNIVAQRYMSNSKGANSPLGGSPIVKDLDAATPLVKEIYGAWLKPNQVQLYDLESDPWEFHDLSANPKYKQVKQRLMTAITDWQKTTNDPLRFPDKLKRLTHEIDSTKLTKDVKWQYPYYMYGKVD